MPLYPSIRHGRVALAAGIAFLAGAPSAASADSNLYSYYGSNYSRDFNYIQQVEACDKESDSRGVHADFLVIGSGSNQQIRDGDGNNGVCGKTGVYSQHIYRHRVVEEVPAAPDNFGPYQYPS